VHPKHDTDKENSSQLQKQIIFRCVDSAFPPLYSIKFLFKLIFLRVMQENKRADRHTELYCVASNTTLHTAVSHPEITLH